MKRIIFQSLITILILLAGCGVEKIVQPDRDSRTGSVPATDTAKDSPVEGIQQVAVILVDFQGTTETYWTANRQLQIYNMMFNPDLNSVNKLYLEMTGGGVGYEATLEDDFFGPFTIDLPGTDCELYNSDAWTMAADAIAVSQVPGYADYDSHLFVYPPTNGCIQTYGIGGAAGFDVTNVKIYDWAGVSVYGHEYGHTHGLSHSGTYDLETGRTSEYGDFTCIMSSSWFEPVNKSQIGLRHASAKNKIFAGWIPTVRVQEFGGPGTAQFYLAPTERWHEDIVDPAGDIAYQAVTVPIIKPNGSASTAWISYRHDEGGFYPVGSIADLMNRVHVQYGDLNGIGSRIACLAAGESVAFGNLVVTALTDGLSDEGQDYVSAEITVLGPPPFIQAYPFARQENADPVYGEVALTYQITIRNEAAAGNPTNYLLQPVVPTGFELVPDPATISLAPGETQVVPVDLILTSDVGDGDFLLSLEVVDEAGLQGTGLEYMNYRIDRNPPQVPTGLTGYPTVNTVVLEWNPSADAVSGVAGYHVYRDEILVGSPTATTFEDIGLISGSTYSYTVTAEDEMGNESAPCSPLQVVLDCGAGTSVAAVPETAFTSSIKISWPAAFEVTNLNTENCGPMTFDFQVYKDNEDDPFYILGESGQIEDLGSGDTALLTAHMVFTSFVDGEYSVIARVSAGNGAADFETFTLIYDTTAPVAPTGVQAELASPGTVVVTWNAVLGEPGGVKKYIVERNGMPVGETTLTEYTDFLPGDGTFTYSVKAVDQLDHQSPAAFADPIFVDNTAPTAPENLAAQACGFDVTLTWEASHDYGCGVAYYRVFQGTREIGTTPALTYQAEVLAPGTYSYSVTAVDAMGNQSGPSNFADAVVDELTISEIDADFDPFTCTATVTWTTNLPANSTVFFGKSCNSLTGVAAQGSLTLNHQVVCDVSSLGRGTTFAYKVRSDTGCQLEESGCNSIKRTSCLSN